MGCGASTVAPAARDAPPDAAGAAEDAAPAAAPIWSQKGGAERQSARASHSRASVVGALPIFSGKKKAAGKSSPQFSRGAGNPDPLSSSPVSAPFAEVKVSDSYHDPVKAEARRASLSLPKEMRTSIDLNDPGAIPSSSPRALAGAAQRKKLRMSRGDSITEDDVHESLDTIAKEALIEEEDEPNSFTSQKAEATGTETTVLEAAPASAEAAAES